MIKFKLDQNDFLNFQLFTVSKSKMIRNKRIRGWILLIITFLCLSYLFSGGDDRFLTYYFLSATLLVAIFYPFYFRWRYKKHYERYVSETYKNRFGQISELDLNEEYLTIKDYASDSKVKISEIEKVDEISDNIFIKIKTGETLIVPKKINAIDDFKKALLNSFKNNKVEWNIETDWRWK
jgi:hypothetical protein